MAIFPNLLLLTTIVFYQETRSDIGEQGVLAIGFAIQILSAIITVLGGSFMIKAFRKSSSFYFWLFTTALSFIPVVYYFIY